jgi:hypothetical protein
VGIPVLELGVSFVVVVGLFAESMSNFSYCSVTYVGCNVVVTAPPTTFENISDVTVASWLCRGATRFLDELQKMCVICLVLILWAITFPIPRLYLDAVSRLR